jgi:group I intron endonuclease
MYTIYKHTCSLTNKSYIGLTSKTIDLRWKEHVSLAFDKRVRSKFRKYYFQNAIKKYGIKNWLHEILQDNIKTIDEANSIEMFLIKKNNTLSPMGYNETHGGKGVRLTEEGKHLHRLATINAINKPDVRKRYLIGIRKSHSTKEFLEKNRLAQKIAQNRPEVRELKRIKMLKRCNSINYVSPRSKPVIQFSLSGEQIMKFKSATLAGKTTKTNISHLCESARGIRRQAGGYIWKYV